MNLKSCFFILTFVLSLCTLACSSTDTQFQEISKQEFDEAFKQYQTYNLVADTMAVDSATRAQIVNKVKQHYHQWKAHIDVFQVGKVHKTGEYMAIIVGVTGELFIHLFNKNAQLIPVDSVLNDRLPMEYHAYSKDSLWAGEDWWEDAGELPLKILVRKHEAGKLKTIRVIKDSTRCFPHAWEAKSIEELRRFIFWGADNTLYLMCYRYEKPNKQHCQSTSKDSPRPYVYLKIKINENTNAFASYHE